LRLKADKVKAAEFVERESRANFPMYEMAQDAKVEGIDFTADKTRALIRVKAQSFAPQVGKFEMTVIEPWVWSGGNWFLHVEWADNKTPFVAPSPDKPTATTSQFTFTINNPQVDLGTHVQGELITGSLRITAPKANYRGTRVPGVPAMKFGEPQWIDENNGALPFTLDTTLISKDIDHEVEVEAIGPLMLFEEITSRAKVRLTAKIQGKVSIARLEQSPAAVAGRFVEVEVQNVGSEPFRIESVRRVDTVYMLGEGPRLPVEVAVGQTLRLPILYTTPAITDGEVVLQLSPGVLPNNDVLIRFRGAESIASNLPQAPSRSQLDSLVRGAEAAAQREAEQNRIRQQK
jgi:hypothetical protein